MKLWEKEGSKVLQNIQDFTVGRDKEFDELLATYDVEGSIAHVRMLGKVGLMTAKEAGEAVSALEQILNEIKVAGLTLPESSEDIHSYIEERLTKLIGDTGKKIHSGRSRNDQVAVDIKLFLRAEIVQLSKGVKELFDILISQSEKYKNILMPGYTHLQVAMPSSFGLWFASFAESFVDDIETLVGAYNIVNRNPLGSGAGYGSSFPLDREMTTDLLHFQGMNYNSMYAQMARGKTEKIVAMALSNVSATLGKLAMDCCLYMNQNFSFISFPHELTTGSSIMPHKKNPDVFEIIRGTCNRLQAIPNELALLMNNLPSGYHRDFQLTKEIMFPSFGSLGECLEMMAVMLRSVIVRNNILEDDLYKNIYTVEAINELVNKGVAFREAYQQIGNQVAKGEFTFDGSKGLHHTHEGSIGNLMNDRIIDSMNQVLAKFNV